MKISERLIKLAAHLGFSAASIGVVLSIKHYLYLKLVLKSVDALAPLESNQYSRFFTSPPLAPDQKKLLDSMFASRQSETNSVHQLLQTIVESWFQSAQVQIALWAVALVASSYFIWYLYRSNPALKPMR